MITPRPLFQSVGDAIDLLSIESISVLGILLCIIAYLAWQNHLYKKDLETKDNKIAEIAAEWRQDLKEGNKDLASMIAKYQFHLEQLLNTPKGFGHHRPYIPEERPHQFRSSFNNPIDHENHYQ